MARQVLSWRRAGGERRQQLKWLASGAAVTVSSIPLGILIGSVVPLVGLAALPAAIGLAILKCRLYNIDRLISRTLAYAIITGLLVGVYAGLVLLATQLLHVRTPVAVAHQPWPRRPCSTRCGCGCRRWWTAGSTAPATTPTRPWPRSQHASKMP